MKLNIEEIVVGGLVGLVFVVVLKAWVIITIPLCAILWSLGGGSNVPNFIWIPFLSSRYWRRLGVPIMLSVISSLATHQISTLYSILPLFGICSIGYGIPTYDKGMLIDNGSVLGRFFYYKVAEEDDTKATWYTRAAIGLLLGISMLPLAFTSLVGWIIGTLALALLMPLTIYLVEGEVYV